MDDENDKLFAVPIKRLDDEQKIRERRLMMALQVAMTGGLNISEAAREVARRTGVDAEAVRIDWYRIGDWGKTFFHLDDPARMLIERLMEIRGMMLACDMELSRLEPQKIAERNPDGTIVRDRDGSVVYRPLEDKKDLARVRVRRLKVALMAMEHALIMSLKFLPDLPDGHPYRWGKKSDRQLDLMSPGEIKAEAAAIMKRIEIAQRSDDILGDENE